VPCGSFKPEEAEGMQPGEPGTGRGRRGTKQCEAKVRWPGGATLAGRILSAHSGHRVCLGVWEPGPVSGRGEAERGVLRLYSDWPGKVSRIRGEPGRALDPMSKYRARQRRSSGYTAPQKPQLLVGKLMFPRRILASAHRLTSPGTEHWTWPDSVFSVFCILYFCILYFLYFDWRRALDCGHRPAGLFLRPGRTEGLVTGGGRYTPLR
jgi:hypothetical protein